eukprot:8788141-Alexandrium_andersonii.AAC.1
MEYIGRARRRGSEARSAPAHVVAAALRAGGARRRRAKRHPSSRARRAGEGSPRGAGRGAQPMGHAPSWGAGCPD